MNVLSLFDGMSCGRIALDRAGLPVTNYYASEIDKYAIQVSEANYPDIIRLGDVTKFRIDKGRKIDLLIAGSPCQGFSFAGKQLNFEDPRSKLFFEFVRILKECRRYNPEVLFLLENVKMKQEYQDVISEALGVKPVLINSSLVSAQLRSRLYWTNIAEIPQPQERNILLKDIITSGKVDRDKSLCLTQRYCGFSGSQNYLRRRYFGKAMGQAVFENGTPEQHRSKWIENPRADFNGIGTIRSLNVIELERLQNLPENYIGNKVSEYEAKRMAGNGWNVNTIQHIFSFIK